MKNNLNGGTVNSFLKSLAKGPIFGIFVFGAVLILFPVLFSQQLFWIHTLALIFINLILCISLRITLLLGLLNLSIVCFMAIGAYTSAVVSTTFEVSFWLTMPTAGIICALLSLLLGFPLLRLKGAYFFIGTVCIAMVVRVFFGNFFVDIFQGIPGFTPIAKPHLYLPGFELKFSSKFSMYYLSFTIMFIILLIAYMAEKSKYGRTWKAISQSEDLALSLGVNAFRYKLLNFTIANFFCGIAGAVYAAMNNIITPHDFELHYTFLIVLFCVVGGLNNFWGPILGAIIMGILSEFMRTLGQWEVLTYGLILVLALIFMPQGVVNLPEKLFSLKEKRKKLPS
jgi:branched-chain amino acid transport system permease protein